MIHRNKSPKSQRTRVPAASDNPIYQAGLQVGLQNLNVFCPYKTGEVEFMAWVCGVVEATHQRLERGEVRYVHEPR